MEDKLQNLFTELLKLEDVQFPPFEEVQLLNESITYYNLRQFITMMINFTSDSGTKGILKDILITLTKMEVLNKPIPSIKKLKSASPEIFK
jgi:hypothetical protein